MLGSIMVGDGGSPCPDGDLDDCYAQGDEGVCPGGADVTIEWDYVTCDDDCHHIEVWRQPISTGSCAGTFTKKADNLACAAASGCSPGTGYDGCWVDSLTYGYNASEPTHYFCYRIEVRTDDGDVLEDSVTCSESFPAEDCFA